MVEIATAVPGVVAARMTGAGFGGCTVNLVRPDAVDALRAAVEERLPGADRPPAAWSSPVNATDGAGRLPDRRSDTPAAMSGRRHRHVATRP